MKNKHLFPMNRVCTEMQLLRLATTAILLATWIVSPRIAQADSPPGEGDLQGGLVVQVGCRNTERLVALCSEPNTLGQALVTDPDQLDAIREQIRKTGPYGRISAIAWQDAALPYADGLVNLLLVGDGVSLDREEVDRVLAPLGTAWIQSEDQWTCYRKPWPEDVDQWTHIRYDATGNAVSQDQGAGPPKYLQWDATPRWNHGVKTSSLLTTHGRIYYILDDSHYATNAPTWALIARDANNGIQLWRRELPEWIGSKGGKKVGPAQANRRLVADQDVVYVPLQDRGPVCALDAASGRLIRTFDETKAAEEVLLANGVLVALVNPNTPTGLRRGQGEAMRLVAVDPQSGDLLWQHAADLIMPLTMASDGEQVVFHDGQAIQSLNLRTGDARWESGPTGQKIEYRDQANPDSPGAEASAIWLAPQFAPTLIMYKGVVAFAGGRQLNVLSAADGRELWRSEFAPSNYSVPVDLFGFDGLLWGPDVKMNLWRPMDDIVAFNAYDPQTGEIKKRVAGSFGYRFQHHRCHQMKVVRNTVISARAGIEFLDTDTGQLVHHHWIRGSCYYGVLPANGRLYVPPHDCACYVRAKLTGLMALNAHPPARTSEIAEDARLEPGGAFGLALESGPAVADDADWPTYRHDSTRSGRSTCSIGEELFLGWQSELGGKLTSPVIAENRVYVASSDSHTLFALDATTGNVLWQRVLGGPIDSPPTIYDGLALCGCRDGCVYAFRASDGELAWRFVAKPSERTIVSRGQLESVWPVHGSVLIQDGLAYFAAGRSSYLDGGIRLYALDPHTGRKVVDVVIDSRQADGSETLDDESVDGFLNDILSSDGERLFMRHQVLNKQGRPTGERVTHLHSPDGYLSAETTNRLLWTYAPRFTSQHQGAFYDVRLSRVLFPSGRILVEGKDRIYGFGQNHYGRAITDTGGQWALFAAPKQSDVPLDLSAREYRSLALSGKQSVDFDWWQRVPIKVWAMVLADDVLFVAGPAGSAATTAESLRGETPAYLLAISPEDGKVLAEMTLPCTPVWDGMAVARGSLYLTLANGQTLSLWSPDSGMPGQPLSRAAWSVSLPPVKIVEEPGLVGHWRFDEGAGLIARDCSGYGHDAEVNGQWKKSDDSTCLIADGSPRAAVIPDTERFQFGNDDFTLAMRVKVDRYDARLLGKEAFPENWWVINLLPKGQAELVLGEGRGASRTVRAATKTALGTQSWRHLVAVVDRQADEVRWYVDGQEDSRQPIPETMTTGVDAAGRDIQIPSTYKPFHGLAGDLRIYRQALSAERVRSLYEELSAETE